MRTRTLSGCVLPVALVAGALITTPQITAPTPAAAAAPAATLSPANPIKLERFNYYSSVPTTFVRPVVLQKEGGFVVVGSYCGDGEVPVHRAAPHPGGEPVDHHRRCR